MNLSLKRVRKQFRVWLYKKKLDHESRYYHKQFLKKNLIIPDEDFLLSKLHSKFKNREARKKGNLSILAVYHHYNWENETLLPALEKFGTVRHYDWFDKYNHQEKDWFHSVRSLMNKDLTSWVEHNFHKSTVDVIFTYLSGELVVPETLERLSLLGVPIVNMYLNDKEGFVGKVRGGESRGSRDICKHFDLCWTSTEDALEKYCVEGALPLYLPEGANPDIHKPYGVDRSIDVSFVGQCYENRPVVIERLKKTGIRVEAYGYGWPNGPLSTEEMVEMYSRSKINLGFGGIAGLNDTYCLKGRDFEIPMSGGLYLTEHNSELENFFDIDREIVTYSGFDDLVGKIRFLLANPQDAAAIRERGMKRAREDHTWEMRLEKVFKILGVVQ